ncbi:mitogen-activated protein kinase kinase kinase 4 [Ostrinia furnacalis]|uniref:mitogen-activated protein kinase kinase kinase 4 n=1 Tax=Ostrinia furnacalis TaxID=93504 RepID=UPI001038E69C|nr:mitogen-activated protein kinase kinase kinase 4 [Ostrinia furnacalis]
MDSIADENYRSINLPYKPDSGHDSDDDLDQNDVVIRNPRLSSSFLLADGGDGSEADLLGTTPPRSRIRSKEIKRNTDQFVQKQAVRVKRTGSDSILKSESAPVVPERLKKRASLKLREARDWKQDMSQREHRAESLPSPVGPAPAVPTLVSWIVESCNRFMSLTSRLKCRDAECLPEEDVEVERRRWPEVAVPPSRVSFHKTFSLLINMGNIEKGCRRTISREEQVWQNELKDLIWLELQARVAGRSLAQQDAFLCSQRDGVPAVVSNIVGYRFVNPNPCRARVTRLCAVAGSREDLHSESEGREDDEAENLDDDGTGCLMFNCRSCTDAVGKAMQEVNALIDAYYNALALYPSCKAMTVDHPLVATEPFQNRIKAMCLWYNTALHMRLKMLAVRRMMRTLRHKRRRPTPTPTPSSTASDNPLSRQCSEASRPCLVRFNCDNPSDSSNSECSTHSLKEDVTSGEDSAKDEAVDDRREDEVDCAIANGGSSAEANGQLTPEIVISDKYGTSDTSASSESGYSSGADAARQDVYRMGPLDDITRLRLLGKCQVSPYREYHHEMLKTQGVRRCMMFVNKMCSHVLHKVHVTLEMPDSVNPEGYQEDATVEVFDDTKDDEDKTENSKKDEFSDAAELRRYGCWSEENLAMRLPSYRNHFLTLSSICMEAVHDYLSLRLEARPERPSCLTVKQLIHELKEGLDISTEMRRDFVRNVEVALKGRPAPAAARRDLLLLLKTYDATVESVLKQYLSYLTTMSETELLGRAGLQAEWAFTARLARRVRCAALLAPITFSDIACNQISRLLTEFDQKFNEVEKELSLNEFRVPNRYTAYMMCRAVQDIYARWREPLLHAAQWARALAAKLARAQPPTFASQREAILNKLLSMREFLVQHTYMVLDRTSVPDEELELTEGLVTRVRVMLLQMFKLGFELHKELFKLVARSPIERAPRRPASMQPPRRAPAAGARRRPDTIIVNETFNPSIHKELHRVVHDTPRAAAARRPHASPPRGRVRFTRSESINEDAVFDDRLFDTLNYGESYTPIERLLSGDDGQLEPATPAASASGAGLEAREQQWAAAVARAVIQFARCWMHFVVRRCDRGRGLRPRWASQGLEFLMLACDPCNTKHLTEEEFEELKSLMDGCISHVVGSRPAAPRAPDAHAPHTPHTPHTPRARVRLHMARLVQIGRRLARCSCIREVSPSPGSPQAPAPHTPPSEPDSLLSFQGMEVQSHSQRVLDAVSQIEETRDAKLREMKCVGRVMDRAVASYEPKLRQLTFKWQRGLKIGAGTFGKVYTVVNTESGQLLAMKELSIGAGDRRALQRAANELRVLEGVIHPHLVRYYGCEVHREEMLIFMELCVEGSLEALVATSGALAEQTTRRYTKQLLSAVAELHARNIAHRDIKSGNIFLTNEGHCLKLGDFGCAVKIRANTTAPGELQGFVGTQAYMAPEVFMKSSGHGRAADIWSLGCVVTEMASGKRPFSEYDSNYQIMFVVGMGGRPEPPGSLSEEGRDFCHRCLTHDPDARARADQLLRALLTHHFLMVKADDDCKCEPAFLIT